jgi:conjugal transfer mating pair stabilization protein TraG
VPNVSRLRLLPRALHRRKTRKAARAWFIITGIAVAAAGLVYNNMQTRIDPAAYAPLLNTIAMGESNGNYNAYFNNPGNSSLRFTDMTVSEVLKWQGDYVDQGSFSSAVGRYQFVRPTLAGLVKQLKLDPQARFDEALQDRLAITLMERRGAVDYVEQKLTREQFAANLAKEWAALPRVLGGNPEESYYAQDGVNKSRVSIDEVYKALASLEA